MRMYETLLERFHQRIKDFGQDKMATEKEKLLEVSFSFSEPFESLLQFEYNFVSIYYIKIYFILLSDYLIVFWLGCWLPCTIIEDGKDRYKLQLVYLFY